MQHSEAQPGITLIDASRYALLHHPAILSQQAQVEIQRGVRDVTSSTFDGTLQSGLTQGFTNTPIFTQLNSAGVVGVETETLTQTTYSAGYTELFRDGISISPSYQANRDISDYVGPSGLNTSVVGLTVTFPLLRGRGHKNAVATSEDAAKEEVTAASLDLDQEISQVVFNTANDYWRLRAAKQFLAVAVDQEQRGKTYVDNTSTLVEADQVPRNDLHEVIANLAQLTSQRISTEASVVNARLQLASDMGFSAEEMLDTKLEPSDAFPDSTSQAPPSDGPASLSYYLRQAMRLRSDYLASKHRTHEQSILLSGAKNNLLPQLNFGINAGYSQGQPGTNVGQLFSAPLSKGLGPNVTGNITFSFPLQNRAAAGAVKQAAGTLKQADLNAEIVARNISQSVGVAVEQVRAASLEVQQSSSAVGEFETSLAGARQKYNMGFGSIVEILTIEDRLTSVENAQIQAELDYALALTQLRFATGTLVDCSPSTVHIASRAFVTLPAFPQP